ncbi:hypothetical protein CKO08_08225 [Halorhodospira halochloris]|nr:hypothetical protein [Halorhodospira halochloris]
MASSLPKATYTLSPGLLNCPGVGVLAPRMAPSILQGWIHGVLHTGADGGAGEVLEAPMQVEQIRS